MRRPYLALLVASTIARRTVISFPLPLPSPKSTYLRAERTASAEAEVEAEAARVATDFWGAPRDEREIIDFVSGAVFDDDGGPSGDRWVDVVSAEPPLVIVHGFLERSYCDQIIDATVGPSPSSSSGDAKHALRRSTMGAEQEESDHRTSSTAWLREERCPVPLRTFASRAAALSGLPPGNMENLQVVQYMPGEEFGVHTDHLDSFNEFDCGGRLCTCLVYLNDSERSAEEGGGTTPPPPSSTSDAPFTGGETTFPEFGASITPRKGSALFFWNTLERPGSSGYSGDMFLNVDRRARHAGLPVLTGEKWVANRWMHPRSFGAGVRGL